MIDKSRISLYDYLKTLFVSVSENLYSMTEPTENTESDTADGFLVTRIGDINDESEFESDAYGWARCYITAYVPKKSRGRLNKDLYEQFESGIESVIDGATGRNDESDYYIMEDSVLSYDENEATLKGNQYHVFVKSFVVVIDKQK